MKKISLLAISLITSIGSYAQYNYGEVLQKSLLFYETQQSGVLPDWNRIDWRSNSGVNDGKDVGLDLTGGWNDAGDHIKFGFPMAFSVTALNWGFLEYKEGYDKANQTDIFLRNIKWVTDYFIKCHPSPNEFYAQVADSKSQDHNFWMPAEMVDEHPMYGQRMAYKLSTTAPGTEVACETAAALASASIMFKTVDPAYSATLLQHAKELYEFGDTYRGIYNEDGNIPASGTYSSNGYQDELAWGALWLYKATGDKNYLEKAEKEYSEPDFLWSLVWDDKSYGNMVLLSIITGKDKYIADAEKHLDFWQKGGGISYSPGGQAHLTQWGSFRHSMNASLTALIYSDNVATSKKSTYHDFAVNQINYILGDNPLDRSFVTGFGKNPPNKPHHRGQHSSWSRSPKVPEESRHTLYGALMGGPSSPDDTFVDDRTDFIANEVATDYNACFQGVVARMVMEFGGTELDNFPQPEEPGVEFVNEVKINGESSRYTELAIWLNNRSGWPARIPNSLSARYFVDITEGIDAGLSPDDYTITSRGAGKATGGLQEWDVTNNIYYVEVEVDADKMPFPGGASQYRREIQVRIEVPASAPATAWDPSNDPSYEGLTGIVTEFDKVSIYSDGKLANGDEPAGSSVLAAGFTIDKVSGIAPFTAKVNASKSNDPEGKGLTYSWDFGNGKTASTKEASTTFETEGEYTVKLTITDSTGATAEKEITVNAFGERSCSFDTPRATSLPSIENKNFSNVHVIGDDGPSLDNVTAFTINWNLENNGLYGFALSTSDGNPGHYVDLSAKVTQNFKDINPSISITSSGFTGLDDDYWVSVDEGNLVLVSKTKEATIYFSNSSEVPVCGEKPTLSNETFSALNIGLYPNPVVDQLHINGDINKAQLTIYSINGSVVESTEIDSDEFTTSLSNLTNGMYLIHIQKEDGSVGIEKIIVNR
ncbi:glycoside hydrolase family 9 protein [Aquimarina agarilytica]|uniref:glycoside hydrolase family 9 protein n=1 Tax=Aquimarina agarilytica TaxID=1087449 RepID=UPI000288F8D9|nr:glycoside hydrolase family 9 protein [Aquimarina agarilytica]